MAIAQNFPQKLNIWERTFYKCLFMHDIFLNFVFFYFLFFITDEFLGQFIFLVAVVRDSKSEAKIAFSAFILGGFTAFYFIPRMLHCIKPGKSFLLGMKYVLILAGAWLLTVIGRRIETLTPHI